MLPIGDLNRLLAEQRRSLSTKSAELTNEFPVADGERAASALECITLVVQTITINLGHADTCVGAFW